MPESTQGGLVTEALHRHRHTCQACGVSQRPVLAVHHVIPLHLGGRDELSNLVVLCANCHRSVHWLATGDRSLHPHAFALGSGPDVRRRLLAFARRIRARRHRVVGVDGVMSGAVPVATAVEAVIVRNGADRFDAAALKRCFFRAWRAIRVADRQACSRRLARGARFLSVSANNHLALRVPAWSDAGYREADIALIWPQYTRPAFMTPRRFRHESAGRFRLIPHFNLWLSWDECLALTPKDWRVYAQAVHDGLTLVRTVRRPSNVLAEG